MNIHEAAKSGKPFYNPSMIGAWLIVDGFMTHRDNIRDYEDMEFIRATVDCEGSKELYWMDAEDLLRNDWEIVE